MYGTGLLEAGIKSWQIFSSVVWKKSINCSRFSADVSMLCSRIMSTWMLLFASHKLTL